MARESIVLVTGAGGFIGGRVVEALLQVGGRSVLPGVRRWSTAARFGRYEVEPVRADLMDVESLRTALSDVDAVIHCAVGSAAVTTQGTRNLLEVAAASKVRRVVHLSTIDVYGRSEGVVDESHPFVETGREYGDSKIAAEKICQEFAARGLEVVILRPTIVYGPFSDLWTIEPAVRLASGGWQLPAEACQGRCNLVYVDDLVRAAIMALDAPGVSGKAYNINGPDDVTWQEYIDALNGALGLPALEPPPPSAARRRTALVEPIRNLIKRTYLRFEEPIMTVYRSSKAARRLMKGVQTALQRVPSTAEYDLYGRDVHFPSTRAEQELEYRPAVPMAQGVELSAQWLRHEGVV